MTTCDFIHSSSKPTAAVARLNGKPLCRRHLNRLLNEMALRDCVAAAPRCEEEGHRNQLPRYRDGKTERFTIFCWGQPQKGQCHWKHVVTQSDLKEAAERLRNELVEDIK